MTFLDFSPPPAQVDRLIVHQFDPARPSPGGIDTCLRGVCRYIPEGYHVAVAGVDTGSGPAGRRVGQWERHRMGVQEFWFLPVTVLDPADQARRIPHAVRVVGGLLRHRRALPRHRVLQVHRMDTAAVLDVVFRAPQLYCIHTQENGLVGRTSDSFWRFLGGAHQRLERRVVTKAAAIVVFNEAYTEIVRRWNDRAVFSPTWYDPALIVPNGPHADDHAILWVGRLEVPKDPQLAVRVLEAVAKADPESPWSLHLLGSGTLADEVAAVVATLPEGIRERVHLHGRVKPEDVARRMSEADLFLMTSYAGYEGYPRVLVEAMASGLPAVVTEGSDTGGIVVDGVTGFTCDRDPENLAAALLRAKSIDRAQVTAAVAELDAPTLVERMLALPRLSEQEGSRA
ncbi:glycosyltransferase family 4 protein [Microbacterium sp. B19]|uniref:glycosyltransferase family 4 protein n=1 Tax=Microbacterium sp. B19 TaxID=96765 RepID=UPI00034B3DB7|nr:glycosyltransferase [Microbacterium sp. B19]